MAEEREGITRKTEWLYIPTDLSTMSTCAPDGGQGGRTPRRSVICLESLPTARAWLIIDQGKTIERLRRNAGCLSDASGFRLSIVKNSPPLSVGRISVPTLFQLNAAREEKKKKDDKEGHDENRILHRLRTYNKQCSRQKRYQLSDDKSTRKNDKRQRRARLNSSRSVPSKEALLVTAAVSSALLAALPAVVNSVLIVVTTVSGGVLTVIATVGSSVVAVTIIGGVVAVVVDTAVVVSAGVVVVTPVVVVAAIVVIAAITADSKLHTRSNVSKRLWIKGKAERT